MVQLSSSIDQKNVNSASDAISDGSRFISPIPYSECEIRSGDTNWKVAPLESDWAMTDDDCADLHAFDHLNSINEDQNNLSLYNYYFEMNTPDQYRDELTSLDGDVSIEDADFDLDNLPDDPAAFWETGLTTVLQERVASPTQISIASGSNETCQLSFLCDDY